MVRALPQRRSSQRHRPTNSARWGSSSSASPGERVSPRANFSYTSRSSWARLGAGRRSITCSCTERSPRNSLIWGQKATSSRLPGSKSRPEPSLENQMASKGTPRDSSRSFKCRPRPTAAALTTWAPGSTSTGRGLPAPQGSSRSRSSTAWTVSASGSTAASASRQLAVCLGAASTAWHRARERAGMFSSRTVKPAAMAWPPKLSSRGAQLCSSWNRFTPPQDRQEPLPMP